MTLDIHVFNPLDLHNKAVIQVQYTMLISPLTVQFAGGNKLQAFNKPATISVQALDPDVVPENQTLGIRLVWSCVNLNTMRPCTSASNLLLEIPENTTQLSYPRNTFKPFNTYQFTV